ncbi:MAG: hypothetical protein ABI779_10835, partial [Acidobacteriota bacterium]
MKATRQSLYFVITFLLATNAAAGTRLLLERGIQTDHPSPYIGVVELVIDPGIDNAKVTVTVDGQRVATSLLSPWRLTVDFGPAPVQHRIAIQATTP